MSKKRETQQRPTQKSAKRRIGCDPPPKARQQLPSTAVMIGGLTLLLLVALGMLAFLISPEDGKELWAIIGPIIGAGVGALLSPLRNS